MRRFWLLLALAVVLAFALRAGIAGLSGQPAAATTPAASPTLAVATGVSSQVETSPVPSIAPPTVVPTASGTATVTATPIPSAPATTPTPTATASPPSPQQTAAEALETERPARDLAGLAVRVKGIPSAAATPAALAGPPSYQIGRQDVFWVSDQKAKTFFPITATVAYVTPHAYFYVQEGDRSSANAIRQAAEAFETRSYPLVRRYVGQERPGPDGDQHITVLNARIPNVGGYFSSDDQYPRTVSPHSNERNIVYINTAAYPPGTRAYDATLAHEFQHLVAWNVYRTADTWFNEGSSELAMRLTGYDAGGAESAYANDPNTQLTGWSQDDGKTGAHYGASYLFLTYFAQHYASDEELPQLFAGAGRGTLPFDSYLAKKGHKARFDDVFRDWVVANFLDDQSVEDGRYWYKDVNLHAKTERVDRYPFKTTTKVEQYGAQYYELPAGYGDVTVIFTGAATSRLLANSAKSGSMQWWSNRGDIMDSTLTREIDLSTVAKATLQFSAWYDIEEGFDYAYVEVSADGGRSWQTLPGKFTTTDDPVGHNLGHGYTGKSGGESATWLDESIDLSAYAGKKILLRFEHVTDDAFNLPGFAVDDIAIPELGWRDNAEGPDIAWRAAGFVRTANIIPQPYSVRLIDVGQPSQVKDVPVDAAGHGSIVTTGLGKDYRRAVLAISPMAKVTSEPAQVQISVVVRQ